MSRKQRFSADFCQFGASVAFVDEKLCRLRIISFCIFRYHNAKKRFKVFRPRSPSALEPQISRAVVAVISLFCRRLFENPVIISVVLVGILSFI